LKRAPIFKAVFTFGRSSPLDSGHFGASIFGSFGRSVPFLPIRDVFREIGNALNGRPIAFIEQIEQMLVHFFEAVLLNELGNGRFNIGVDV
jgi:hypothetical protein